MKKLSLKTWLKLLESRHFPAIKLGLTNSHEVKGKLCLDKIAKKIISVAGTNGKGSSIALLESILISFGYKVGTYTSPHLRLYNERIKIDGIPVQDCVICDAFSKVEVARGDIDLTYFEFSTLAAFSIFADKNLDFALLEVGLGGRLDAVNCVDSDIALITSIGLDHQKFLGFSRQEIGFEKAGIMRAEMPCVCSDPSVPGSIISYARSIKAKLKLLGADFFIEQHDCSWDWWNSSNSIMELSTQFILGDYQLQNAAGVLEVISLLESSFDRHLIKKGFDNIRLEGRFQRVLHGGNEHLFDVAHNPQAAKALADNLSIHESEGRTFGIVALMKTKDITNFLRPLISKIDFWYFPELEDGQGYTGELLKNELEKLSQAASVTCCGSVEQAYKMVKARLSAGDIVLVTGSFLTVGCVMRYLDVPVAK